MATKQTTKPESKPAAPPNVASHDASQYLRLQCLQEAARMGLKDAEATIAAAQRFWGFVRG